MYGIYLPPGTVIAERYTVNLYDTEQEAQADLARVQRRHGTRAFIAPCESSDCPCGYSAGTRPTQIGCGAKDCPNRTESRDSVETGEDMGGRME
jgi:hypothetical protein